MPGLAPGQALVEVRAVGLNMADLFCALGLYKAAPSGPFVPGLEFSGVVLAVHPDAAPGPPGPDAAASEAGATPPPGLKPGDRVIGVTRFGAYASHAALDARYLRPLPPGWGFDQGAGYAVQALTAAYGLLVLGDLAAACRRRPGGARVLVQSAAGGVGLYALAICRALGARALGLVGSEAKAAALRRLLRERERERERGGGSGGAAGAGSSGGDEAAAGPIGGVDVAARVRGEAAARAQLAEYLAGDEGFDVFMDSAAGDYLRPGFDALAPCGRWGSRGRAEGTSYGAAAGEGVWRLRRAGALPAPSCEPDRGPRPRNPRRLPQTKAHRLRRRHAHAAARREPRAGLAAPVAAQPARGAAARGGLGHAAAPRRADAAGQQHRLPGL
jgi:NADPH:quinone reductase-like Zn-dependent oxidoreductase